MLPEYKCFIQKDKVLWYDKILEKWAFYFKPKRIRTELVKMFKEFDSGKKKTNMITDYNQQETPRDIINSFQLTEKPF